MTGHGRERLGHHLKLMALQIEQLLASQNLFVNVAGGIIQGNRVRFDVGTCAPAGQDQLDRPGQLTGLENALQKALGVPSLHIDRQEGRLMVTLSQQARHPVDLQDLTEANGDPPPMTAVLGLSQDRRPVLLNLGEADTANVLIAGGPGAGKTTLLRTILLSLALANRPATLQLAIIDLPAGRRGRQAGGRELYPLNYLPHMLTPVIESADDAHQILARLVEQMRTRLVQGVNRPLLLLAIDGTDALLATADRHPFRFLIQLLQDGPGAGIHVILGCSEPGDPHLSRLMKCNIPVRLAGQLRDHQAARAATGIFESGAERLLGKGDFVAAANGTLVHFQAAGMSDSDLHLVLEKWHRQRRQAIVARPVSTRPTFPTPTRLTATETAFTIDTARGSVVFGPTG